ncbi:ArsR family transcriptional regulator [Sulfitobacter sp. F26169L]|uniref:GbsR/MarR family transcriptional regulator n=1 Tax=Sulfitobacter sp. F26169L TaxID=2996015 RepID=UPI002260D020|nr:ArsR family transcriptional regulator [Sulfitobacter sp. F26169L]MCX7566902.1 ArsR family transcriptional regulator [Sulfitobacter sp. F26169L]
MPNAPDPLSADEIFDLLNLARSNLSNGLKELKILGMVNSQRKLGDRRDHFTSIRDMFELTTTIIESRRERECLPTLRALEEVSAKPNKMHPRPAVKERIKETLETMQMFDGWYTDVSRLPRSVQIAAIRLGVRIARFLSKDKDS